MGRDILLAVMYQRNRVFYTYACIYSARIEQYHYYKQLNENCSSHTWNEEDGAFDQQLEKRGVENLFLDQP